MTTPTSPSEGGIVPDSIEHRFQQFGPRYRYLVTFAGMLGVMSMVLSVTIVNVAVPSVMGAYGIGRDCLRTRISACILVIPDIMSGHFLPPPAMPGRV